MTKKNVLLLYGGGSSEHDISVQSSKFISKALDNIEEVNYYCVELLESGSYQLDDGTPCRLSFTGNLVSDKETIKIDYAIPCLHGFPGETGDIQSVFELCHIGYFGCDKEASQNCFNKVTTKLWFDALNIPNTPSVFLSDSSEKEIKKAKTFFKEHGAVFVKAASQGSSVGCYWVTEENNLEMTIVDAFNYSPHVLVEKALKARELEIAAYTYNGKLTITDPGEILTPDSEFYSFEEKYGDGAKTTTNIKALNLTADQINKMKKIAKKAFIGMKLKDLSRIDFFLTENGDIYVNEINTFPGMTPISMFPKMLESNGDDFVEYLKQHILK